MSLLHTSGIVTMIQRALNMVDVRLVDHGLRVARIFDAMLRLDNAYGLSLRESLDIMAFLHDVGAYRTDEIDQMLTFEAENTWRHAIYGYLFLRELSPLGRLSEVVLYHHLPYDRFIGVEPDIARFAQMLQVADRVDVLLMQQPEMSGADILAYLHRHESRFGKPALELFEAADRRWRLIDSREQPASLADIFPSIAVPDDVAVGYLQMLVHAIDFRSRTTVAHSINTTQIGRLLAQRMGLSDAEQDQIYSGALIHDMGKIGIPFRILEKPGALTEAETAVMRTHVDLTEQIIGGQVDKTVARIALHHHEKLDGRGYSKQLTAESLTIPERIVAVSDIVSALGSTRSYKAAFPREKIMAILDGMGRRGQVDFDCVRCVEQDYDSLMADAAQFYLPIEGTYRKITEEYASLIKRFA